MKNLLLLVTFLSLFTFKPAKALQIDSDDLYCVHGTNFMLKNSTAIAGASTRDLKTDASILHKEGTLEIRQTLHHCLGGLAPEDSMITITGSFMGVPMSASNGGHDNSRYAFIEPLSVFIKKKEVFGGQVNDVMTTSHTYGEDSFMVVPESDKESFWQLNKKYSGKLYVYDPTKENLRKAVNRVLEERGIKQYKLSKRSEDLSKCPVSLYSTITLDGTVQPLKSFEELFLRHNLYIGAHSASPFQALENMLKEMRKPFILCSLNQDEPWKHELSCNQLEDLANLLEFQFGRFFELCEGLIHKDHLIRLHTWKEDCFSYLRLLQLNMKFKGKKSIFYKNPQYEDHVTCRHDISFETLDASLVEIPLEQRKEESHSHPIDNVFLGQDISELGHFAKFMIEKKVFKVLPTKLVFKALFLGPFHGKFPDVFEDKELDALSFALVNLEEIIDCKDKQDLLAYLRTEFWEAAMLDTSVRSTHVIKFLQPEKHGSKFRALLGVNPANEFTFEELLLSHPLAKHLLPDDTFVVPYCSFVKVHIRKNIGTFKTLRDFAQECSDLITQVPLALGRGKVVKGQPKGTMMRRIEDGEFGSIHDIFTSMNLGDTFRKKFPTDEDFWIYNPEKVESTSILDPNYPTFKSIYRELVGMK